MPWLETAPVEQRERFLRDYQLRLYTVVELSARYGISRKTAYKWLARFDAHGRAGLRDRSRAPHHCPHRILDEVDRVICDARRQHPSWGPEKLLAWLAPRHPALTWPAVSTAGDLLARRGLVKKRRRRRQYQHPGVVPLTTATQRPVDGGLQRTLPHAGRDLLLPADRRRSAHPLLARVSRVALDQRPRRPAGLRSPLPGARVAARNSHRQRRPVRHHRHPRPLPAQRVV